MAENAIIQAEGLSKYYGDRIALRGAAFTVTRGECVGFLGRNGAGKSTLLKILATALLPSAGSVRIGEIDAVHDPDAARRRIGFLPEEPPLYPEMTVRAYLRFLAELRGYARDVEARVEEVARQTSLVEVLDDVIGTLSLGFRKRVGIAQAIVHEPDVVIVDEPISGLDPVQIVEIRNLIRSLRGRHTVLVSSHILSELSETCDRFLLVDRGAIVAQGTEEELTGGRGAHGFEVEVRGAASALESALKQVPSITVKGIRADGERAIARVDLPDDAPEAIAARVIDAGLALRRLSPLATDLEAVFLEITGGAAARTGAEKRDAA